jgi:Tfp pilus assembly protein PilX
MLFRADGRLSTQSGSKMRPEAVIRTESESGRRTFRLRRAGEGAQRRNNSVVLQPVVRPPVH